MTIPVWHKMTEDERANDREYVKAIDDTVRLQDKTKAKFDKVLLEASETNLNSHIVGQSLKVANELYADWTALKNIEVILENVRYRLHTTAGNRTEEALRRLTGSETP